MASAEVAFQNHQDSEQMFRTKLSQLYETANHKTLKFPEITQTINVRFRFELKPVTPTIINQDLKKKKRRRGKASNPERRNNLVKRVENTQLEQYKSPTLIKIPAPPPLPLEWLINWYMLYFKTLEQKVLDQINATTASLNEKGLKELQILTEDLKIFLNKLEQFYHDEDLEYIEEHPLFEDILESVEKLQKIFCQLKDSDIPNVLKNTVNPSRHNYICSILGLDDDVAKFLSENDYYSDEQWILEFLSRRENELTEFRTWQEAFQTLGFNPIKAKALGDIANSNQFSFHDSPSQWASRHIEQQFKYNILLRSPNIASRHEWNNEHNINEYYFIPTDISDNDEDVIKVKAIDKFNMLVEEIKQDPSLSSYLLQKQSPMSGVAYWFHSTDHDSALNIVRNGIDLSKGRSALDFSDGKGFYLTRLVANLKFPSYINLILIPLFS